MTVTTKPLTPAEAGEYLGVPARTLADWRYRGIGPAYYKAGKLVRYRAADLDAWLQGNRHGGDAA